MGWLSKLTENTGAIFSINIEPIDNTELIEHLDARIRDATSLSKIAKNESIKQVRNAEVKEASDIISRMINNNEVVSYLTIYICITSQDEIDLNKVCFSLDNFKAYSEGFLLNLKSILTKDEIDNLAFSANLITLEQAIRFLDDYLNGDSYYKTEYKNHNLIRAKNQIKLASEIEKNIVTMNDVIKELIK